MAYTDRKGLTTGQIWAIGIVILVHILLAWAFITGMAYKVAAQLNEQLDVIDVQEPPPPPEKLPPPPPKQNLPPPPVVAPPPIVRTNIAPPPSVTTVATPPPVFVPTPEPPRAAPPPPPPPPPAPPPVKVTPRGNPQSWVTSDDYPPSAQREGLEGRVGVRLDVSPDGRPNNCSVTSSSGHGVLDDAACRLLMRRAKFNPGRDASGNPAGGVFTYNFRWQLPEE